MVRTMMTKIEYKNWEYVLAFKGVRTRIQKRVSYRMWKELLDLMKEEPWFNTQEGLQSVKRVLMMTFQKMDERHAFGSATNAYATLESLIFLLWENKVDVSEFVYPKPQQIGNPIP
jgi:hypothetical protein